MNTMNRIGSTLVLLAFTGSASAQVAFGGKAFGLMAQGPYLPEAPVLRMPEVDAAALIAEDEARYATGIKGPYRFGFNHATDISTETHGVWHELRNGDRVWRTTIECPGAFSINFVFRDYLVPEGGLVFVYNEMDHQLGAFTAASSPGRTSMGVGQLAGERITVEYYEPLEVRGEGRLRIDQVTHGYRDVFRMAKDFGSSGACNVNVICPEGDDWRDQISSTAIITVGGSGFCTGTLINNCAEDGTPFFLTANHCLDADVENWVFVFNWDSPTCDPTENAPMDQSVAGCQLLVNSTGTDVALLQLSAAPPEEYEVFYSGWDKSSTPAEWVVGIHHPAGDIKKISKSNDPVIPGTMSGADCWHVQAWNSGTTEPGSSGSGLWNQNKLLVGQLFGGQASCSFNFNDYYGRLDVSWPLLEPHLGSCGDELPGLGDGGGGGGGPDVDVDAAVTSINNIPNLVCGSNWITPMITLKNNGTSVVTVINVDYGVAGQPQYSAPWYGNLQPGQTVNYNLPAIWVPTGEQVLTVTCSSPNGQVDQVGANDSWSHVFVVNNPGGMITLELIPDNYGSDITWTLEDAITGTVLYSGGPYDDFHAGDPITVPFCLTNSCYVFTINDLFGDGICCEQGEGSLTITDTYDFVHVESDGQYGAQFVSTTFCPTVVSIPEHSDAGDLVLFPNPTAGMLQVGISGMKGTVALTISDGLGRMVRQTSLSAGQELFTFDLSGEAPGVYLMAAEHDGGRVVRRVVVQR